MSIEEPQAMGRVTVDVELANNRELQMAEGGMLAADQVHRVRLSGIVDSGASYLVLPESIATQLRLPMAGTATVRYADARSATRQVVDQISLELAGRRGTFKAILEPNRTDALIGAIVLEDLDLLVDCRTQTVHPRDPDRIVAEIE